MPISHHTADFSMTPDAILLLYEQKDLLLELQDDCYMNRNKHRGKRAWDALEGILNLLDVISDACDPSGEFLQRYRNGERADMEKL